MAAEYRVVAAESDGRLFGVHRCGDFQSAEVARRRFYEVFDEVLSGRWLCGEVDTRLEVTIEEVEDDEEEDWSALEDECRAAG